MNIYVGNLSLETTEDDLRRAFEAFGQVRSVNIVKDRVTGESRGFGFVGMPSASEAQKALEEMNGKDLKGQTIKAEEGRTKTSPAAFTSGRTGTDRRHGGIGGRGGGDRGGNRRGGSGRSSGRRY